MKKYINDKSPFSNSLDEMDGEVLIFEGHDRPRYIYPFNNEAGYLGLDDWSQYWNKPTFSSEVVGKLDATKYYSIVVVPVKTDISVGGLPIYGEATKPSIPQKPTSALRGFIFNIPTHTQTVIKDCGIAYSTENDAVTDDDKTWTVNEHVGKTLKNVETGVTSTITANTATTITSAGAVFNSGDRYQITSISVKARLVYACEMASAFSVNTSNYYLAGVINDNTSTTFTMNSFVESADIWDFDAGFLAPPSASSVKNVSGVMFCGGGITEERGTAKIVKTIQAIEATATANEEVTLSIQDDDYDGALTSKVVRVTLGSAQAVLSDIQIGSYVSITDSVHPENNVSNVRVTRVADDGTWFEFINNSAKTDATFVVSTPVKTGAANGVISTPVQTDDAKTEQWELVCSGTDTIFVPRNVDYDAGNTGTGTLINIAQTDATVAETWTLTCTAIVTVLYPDSIAYDVGNSGSGLLAVSEINQTNGTEETYTLTCAENFFDYAASAPTKVALSGLGNGVGTVTEVGSEEVVEDWTLECTAIGYDDPYYTNYVQSAGPVLSSIVVDPAASLITWGASWFFSGGWKASVSSSGGYLGTFSPGARVTVAGEVAFTINGTSSYTPGIGTSFQVTKDRNYADTFLATGTVSGAQATPAITSGVATPVNINDFFSVSITNGTEKWAVGSQLTFSITSSITGGRFGVVGEGSHATGVPDIYTGVPYISDYFNATLTDTVGDPFIVGDIITFDVIAVPQGGATFSVVGDVSSTDPVNLTSGATYTGSYFTAKLLDSAVKWAVGDIVTFDFEAAAGDGEIFTVTGELSGEQDPLTIGEDYANDYFSMSVAQGETPWSLLDKIVFQITRTDIDTTDTTAKISIIRNYIQGKTGFDPAYFTEGMVDAKFQFITDSTTPLQISWVDPISNKIGIASRYLGTNSAYADFKISSDYPLYYSDSRNPHRIRSGSIIDVGDSVTGISSVGDNVLCFCRSSLWRISVESLGAAAVLISDNIRCPAQFSIVKGEKLVAFYDGTGISVTDGVTAASRTSYKAKEYLANINKAYEQNIVGVYDRENRRFEFVFPMGDETQNNYGLYITEDTWNCYPFSRPDCNFMWTNYDSGNLRVYHGTSGELTDGNGSVWKHSGELDGINTAGVAIDSISGQDIVIFADAALTLVPGDFCTIYPIVSGEEYKELIIESATEIGTNVYRLSFNSSFDLSAYEAGDMLYFGYIPFDYGIKWTDFSSPQYRHQVRNIQLEIENMTGKLYVDHFLDMNETPVVTNEYDVTPADTKITVPFRMGKCYKYGFRLRGMSSTQLKISSFELMFDSQV